VGQPVVIKRLDLNKCTLADAEGVDETPYEITMPFPITISGYASWFTVDFNGSKENPVTKRVTLSTGPEMGYTHWGQQVFYLRNAVDASERSKLHGTVSMTRQEKNKRLYNLNLVHNVDDEAGESVKCSYEIP